MGPCAALQLITIIRQDLNLTKSGVSGANVAAITGTIFARVASAHCSTLFCVLSSTCHVVQRCCWRATAA